MYTIRRAFGLPSDTETLPSEGECGAAFGKQAEKLHEQDQRQVSTDMRTRNLRGSTSSWIRKAQKSQVPESLSNFSIRIDGMSSSSQRAKLGMLNGGLLATKIALSS